MSGCELVAGALGSTHTVGVDIGGRHIRKSVWGSDGRLMHLGLYSSSLGLNLVQYTCRLHVGFVNRDTGRRPGEWNGGQTPYSLYYYLTYLRIK